MLEREGASVQLIEPASVRQAVEALATDEFGSKVIAGGTAVVLMMGQGLIQPETLVSLQRIPGLRFIRETDAAVAIGAGTTLSEIASSDLVRHWHPSLAHACGRVANIRIRNAATLGGNLAEADYASDPPSALVALDATVRITGAQGERESSVADLLVGFYTTTLEPSEIITEIVVPKRDRARSRDTYLKFLSRSSEDRPCVGVAASATFSPEGEVDLLRVVVGAAAAIPQRFPDAEALALGSVLADADIAAVADAYAGAIDPIDDLRGSAWYRRQMTRTFVTRALRSLRHADLTPAGREES